MTTWNPSDKGADITLSGGNLTATSASGFSTVRSTTSKAASKVYFEATCVDDGAQNQAAIGVLTSGPATNDGPSSWITSGAAYGLAGAITVNGSTSGSGSNLTPGDVLGVAVDLSANRIYFSVNGTYQASGNPAAGTGGQTIDSGTYFAGFGINSFFPAAATVNFGGSSFTTAPPTGYIAWDVGGSKTLIEQYDLIDQIRHRRSVRRVPI